MCQSVHLSHTSPTYSPSRLRKNPISRNVRIVGSAVVTSWQAVRRNNKASAPVSSWLHQLCNARLWINDTHSSPARFMSLQTFKTDTELMKKKKSEIHISSPLQHQIKISFPRGNKRLEMVSGPICGLKQESASF